MDMDIKYKLSDYYTYLINQISKYSTKNTEIYQKINVDELSSLDIFEHIKRLISVLIDEKIEKDALNNNNYDNYKKLENYSKKLEKDLKFLYQKIFEDQIQINAFEDKIKIYKIIQQEYEQLKEKVKFYNGKFLDNERKDNEILILRKENKKIKKNMEKFNKINELNETLKINYITKINELNKEIETLNKKLEAKSNINNYPNDFYNTSSISNAFKNSNSLESNLFSKMSYKSNINEINNIISSTKVRQKKYDYLKSLKKLFHKSSIKNKKRQNNFNIAKSLYLNSNSNLKYIYNYSTVNTSGQNIFTVNFTKICSTDKFKKIAKNRNKNNRNSNAYKIKNDEINQSFSLNKYIRKINNINHKNRHKSNLKNKKSFNNIKSFRPIESCPISFRNKYSSKGTKNCK